MTLSKEERERIILLNGIIVGMLIEIGIYTLPNLRGIFCMSSGIFLFYWFWTGKHFLLREIRGV